MSTERSLSERVLDVVVYAPIGLAAHVRDQHTAYVEVGRERFEQTVQVARFLGKMAVDQGQKELRKRFDRSARPDPPPAPDRSTAADPVVGADAADVARAETPPRPATDPLITGIVSVGPIPTGPGSNRPSASELSLADYDSLAASQVVLRLDDLQPDEVEAVRVYEAAHRSRRTVMAKIAQLQGG